jgi:hypothetical protein
LEVEAILVDVGAFEPNGVALAQTIEALPVGTRSVERKTHEDSSTVAAPNFERTPTAVDEFYRLLKAVQTAAGPAAISTAVLHAFANRDVTGRVPAVSILLRAHRHNNPPVPNWRRYIPADGTLPACCYRIAHTPADGLCTELDFSGPGIHIPDFSDKLVVAKDSPVISRTIEMSEFMTTG